MRRLAAVLVLLVLALSSHGTMAEPLLRVMLVGDSTMAPRTGYGEALCRRFKPDVACLNLARGGRSSASFRAEGLWDQVTALLRDDKIPTLVLVQFGHNDQPGKAGRSTDLATEFPANMARYVAEAKTLGATPVLLTPLTRRSFRGTLLDNDLRPWAEATLAVAAAEHVTALDLNAISAAAVQAMGEAEAETLAMAPPPAGPPVVPYSGFDRTHLGAKGAAYFSQMVATELARQLPAVGRQLVSDQ